jgi:hypothetical protein
MEGVKKQYEQGFMPEVFESVIDTLAGGVTLDLTGYANPDNIVPAGTLIGKKNTTTGLARVVTIVETPGTGGAPATYSLSEAPQGFLQTTIKADANPLASVVIEGVVRKAVLQEDYQVRIALIEAALPKITIV